MTSQKLLTLPSPLLTHAITPFRHTLAGAPAFEPSRLVRLSESLGDVGHWQGRCPWTEEVHVVKKRYRTEVPLRDAILHADTADAYVYMTDVQRDPEFAVLVGACFDEVQAATESSDPGMRDRRGWVIVSSPHSNCPYHRDLDTVMLLQVTGHKRLYAWDPLDSSVCSQLENETLFCTRSQERTVFRDGLLEKANVVELEPGDGVYLPFSSPHVALVPGDGPSVSLSLSFVTLAGTALMGVHRTNRRLRRLAARGESRLIRSIARTDQTSYTQAHGDG